MTRPCKTSRGREQSSRAMALIVVGHRAAATLSTVSIAVTHAHTLAHQISQPHRHFNFSVEDDGGYRSQISVAIEFSARIADSCGVTDEEGVAAAR